MRARRPPPTRPLRVGYPPRDAVAPEEHVEQDREHGVPLLQATLLRADGDEREGTAAEDPALAAAEDADVERCAALCDEAEGGEGGEWLIKSL